MASFNNTAWNNTSMDYFSLYVYEESLLQKFYRRYQMMHGYVSSSVCIFGMLSNIINVIVLTRKHMIKPVNCILTAIAIADFFTMSIYLIHAVQFYILKEPEWYDNHSESWVYFLLFHTSFVITSHNVSVWLTVHLAVFRYIFVCHNKFGNREISIKQTILTLAVTGSVVILLCIPNFFLYQVIALSDLGINVSGYWLVYSNFALKHPSFTLYTFWFYGVVMKNVPCIILACLCGSITLTMYLSNKQRRLLQGQATLSTHGGNLEHNRTTRMLVAVVMFSVVVEMPGGVLAMISGLNDNFFVNVYSSLGDVLDLLVLLNSTVNFILYCAMSRQFRSTFKDIMICFKSVRPLP